MVGEKVTIRAGSAADLDRVIEVGTKSLGWNSGESDAAVFRWKHLDNPFGPSWLWIAEREGQIAGYRAFMRWELTDRDARTWHCVRAVDTATHPDFRRQGIFSKLTMHAVDSVGTEGIDIVFNTPNEQSRPGYLRMGWVDVGRLPIHIRPTGPRGLVRVIGARASAGKWAEGSAVGEPVATDSATRFGPALAGLVESQPPRVGLHTAWDAERLKWRYGLAELGYRLWTPSPDRGAIIFRIRRRGQAREATIGHVLAAEGDRALEGELLRGFAKVIDADYLITLGRPRPRAGFVPLPRLGPRLTARSVTATPPGDTSAWDLDLGDIELF